MSLPSIAHPFTNPKADGADATVTRPSNWNAAHTLTGLVLGQCRLTLSGGSLVLSRFNGNALFIQDQFREVPASGPTLAATGLTANTAYFIYAYWTGSAIALEASITTYATDATYGHSIKNGDSSRTLVGMARVIAGPAWVDTPQQRFVRSWFNPIPLGAGYKLTTDRTSVAAAYVETNVADRVEFLVWAREAGAVATHFSCWIQAAGAMRMFAAIMVNGSFLSGSFHDAVGAAENAFRAIVGAEANTISEGYNHVSPGIGSSNGTQVTMFAGGYSILRVEIA
jgi:hypothetical protein